MVISPRRARRNRILAAVAACGAALLLLAVAHERAASDRAFWVGWVPAALAAAALTYAWLTRKLRRRLRLLRQEFPPAWRAFLTAHVPFFARLDEEGRKRFEATVLVFLDEKRITGVKTRLTDETRLLVAASAVIPIFGFPEWEYDNLAEVLVYPGSFNQEMQFAGGEGRNILGMVHTGGALNRIMILSQPDLERGFRVTGDRQNVGIHEFGHLVDGADGSVDGVPAALCPACVEPWLETMRKEMQRLRDGDSILNRYGLTNEAEFFAVASEAFFDAPQRLADRHPELYGLLQRVFNQDLGGRWRAVLRDAVAPRRPALRRRSPCPCGSGKRFGSCCGATSRLHIDRREGPAV